MLIATDRRYRFDVGVDELWDAVTRTGDYRRWWPWLRRLDGAAFVEGAEWRCVVQPPLPYTLRFRMTVVTVRPAERVEVAVDGDIEGDASLALGGDGEAGSNAHLVSRLAPSNRMLSAVARVAAPMVRFGHDWVLDAGCRQFTRKALG